MQSNSEHAVVLTLKMTSRKVLETSVTVTNSSFQNYTHPDDHTRQTTDTPGFKPFTVFLYICKVLTLFSTRHTETKGPIQIQ